MRKIPAVSLADYILKHYGPMSHLKLQKILFYADAYHLAFFDEELVPEKFEAWMHGPVCRVVFKEFKDKSILHAPVSYEDRGTKPDERFAQLSDEQKDYLNDILPMLSKHSSQALENATHREKPWLEAREGYDIAEICEVEISKETTKEYYAKAIEEEDLED